MTLRGFYRAAALLPLVGLVIAAALRGATEPSALPPGWDWIYPSSITRGLVAYSLVAGWLWVQIGRRPAVELRRIILLAPVAYVGAGWALMLGLASIQGRVAELWEEHSAAILLRTGGHLVFGYVYIALVHFALHSLRGSGKVLGEGSAR